MDYLALVNRARQLCGVGRTDLTTLSGVVGENARFANWINEAWMDVQTMRTDWLWMRRSVSFPLVSGQPIYTPAQIGITDFGAWVRNSFRNYANPQVTISIASPGVVSFPGHGLSNGNTVTPYTSGALPIGLTAGTSYFVVSATTDTFSLAATSGGTPITTSGTQTGIHTITSNNTLTFAGFRSEIFMDYIEYDEWRDGYEYGALRQIQTRPTGITITPAKALGMGPFPVSGYTVVGDYNTVPSELSANTDTPALPTKYHMLIVYKAMMAYGAFESAAEVYQRGEIESGKWMRRLLAEQTYEITACGALA